MKVFGPLCPILAAAAILSTTNCKAQTPTTSATARKPVTTRTSPAQTLPFDTARDETLMLFWTAPPPAPGMGPVAVPNPNGSAVWIGGSGYVATCYHVIKGSPGPFKIGIARAPYLSEGQLSVTILGGVNVYTATLVDKDEDADIAILKADISPGKIDFMPLVTGAPTGTPVLPRERVRPRGATLNTDPPLPGDTLLLAGFPIAQDTERTLILQPGIATGFLVLTQGGPPAKARRIMLSLVSNPGNSGGPVFDANGNLIGLLEGNLTTAVRTNQNGIAICAWVKPGPDGQPEKDPTTNQPVPPKIDACQQNTGISFAVPAKLIEDLAKDKKIDLR